MKAILIGFLMLGITALGMQSCQKDPGFNGSRTISGKVTYPQGDAAGALVKIKFNATETSTTADYTTVTDNTGSYKFYELAPGDYVIWATYNSPEGLEYSTSGYKVKLGEGEAEAKVDMVLN